MPAVSPCVLEKHTSNLQQTILILINDTECVSAKL